MLTPRYTVVAGLLALGLATTASAGSNDAVIGAVIGAGVGAAVGHNVDGRSGAMIGGAIGAVAGTAIATNRDRDDRDSRDYRHREVRYVEPVHYRPAPVVYQQPVYVTPAYYPRHVTYYQPRAVKVKYRYYDDNHRHGHKHWKHGSDDDRDWRRGHRDNDRRDHDHRWD